MSSIIPPPCVQAELAGRNRGPPEESRPPRGKRIEPSNPARSLFRGRPLGRSSLSQAPEISQILPWIIASKMSNKVPTFNSNLTVPHLVLYDDFELLISNTELRFNCADTFSEHTVSKFHHYRTHTDLGISKISMIITQGYTIRYCHSPSLGSRTR